MQRPPAGFDAVAAMFNPEVLKKLNEASVIPEPEVSLEEAVKNSLSKLFNKYYEGRRDKCQPMSTQIKQDLVNSLRRKFPDASEQAVKQCIKKLSTTCFYTYFKNKIMLSGAVGKGVFLSVARPHESDKTLMEGYDMLLNDPEIQARYLQ